MATLGIGGCFFAEDILVITLLWGVVLGLSYGFAHNMQASLLNQHFKNGKSKANGFVLSGSCIGGALLPALTSACIQSYGTSGSFLVLSAIIAHTIPASLLVHYSKITPLCNIQNESGIIGNKNDKNSPEISNLSDNYSMNSTHTKQPKQVKNISSTGLFISNSLQNSKENVINRESASSADDSYFSNKLHKERNENVKEIGFVLHKEQNENVKEAGFGLHKEQFENVKETRLVVHENENANETGFVLHEEQFENVKETGFVLQKNENVNETGFGLHEEQFENVKETGFVLHKNENVNETGSGLHEEQFENVKETGFVLHENGSVNETGFGLHKEQFVNVKETGFVLQNEKHEFAITKKESENGHKTIFNKSKFTLRYFRIFIDPPFIAVLFTNGINTVIITAIWTIILDFIRDKDVPTNLEIYYVIILSIADCFGRAASGYFLDKRTLTLANFCLITFIVEAATLVVIVYINNYILVMVCEILIATCIGITVLLEIALTHEFVEQNSRKMAMSCRLILYGPLSFTISPMIGYFRGGYGSYDNVFYILSAASLLCGLISYLLPRLAKRKQSLPPDIS
nr:uncharacterized protein LOC122270068 [Parasteatoda tepidariorum]